MALKGPPCAVPGRRSNVSLWLGPPSIHSRMHDLVFARSSAARPAKTLSQPDSPVPRTPAADNFSMSRREKSWFNMSYSSRSLSVVSCPWLVELRQAFSLLMTNDGQLTTNNKLMVKCELTRIHQRPQHVAVGAAWRLVALLTHEVQHALALLRRRQARQGVQVQPLDDLGRHAIAFLDARKHGLGGVVKRPEVHEPQRLRNAGLIIERIGPFIHAKEVHEILPRPARSLFAGAGRL